MMASLAEAEKKLGNVELLIGKSKMSSRPRHYWSRRGPARRCWRSI